MSTIILQVDEYEELVRACEKAEARVEELEDLLASVTPEKDAEGIILNAKRRLGGEPGDSLIQLCIKAKYDCDRYLAAMEWQPIETAPKDGTHILVYPPTWPGGSASIAFWNDDKYAKRPRPFWCRDDDFGRVTDSRQKSTTHWMPLPDPPKA